MCCVSRFNLLLMVLNKWSLGFCWRFCARSIIPDWDVFNLIVFVEPVKRTRVSSLACVQPGSRRKRCLRPRLRGTQVAECRSDEAFQNQSLSLGRPTPTAVLRWPDQRSGPESSLKTSSSFYFERDLSFIHSFRPIQPTVAALEAVRVEAKKQKQKRPNRRQSDPQDEAPIINLRPPPRHF